MKTPVRPLVLKWVLLLVLLLHGALAAEDSMDWNRARELFQRSQRGEKLSAADQAYLERARRLRAQTSSTWNRSASGTEADPAAREPVLHLIPLTELGQERYQGEDGGLYGSGRNEPPALHLEAAKRECARIQPLDREGQPSPSGKIVLLSIGMSNTTQEFSQFKRLADADPEKSPLLVIVDGAQGGQDAVRTCDEFAPFWNRIDERLRESGVAARQVQVAWIKQAIAGPSQGFPAETKRLQELLVKIVNIARKRYPNLRLAYLSSRTYAGYATTRLNPEPYAYESALAVRGLILDQFKGNPPLNDEAARGSAKAPLLLWGPYLWADGLTPRKSDGFSWKREDFGGDGTHPSASGRQKVADLLLQFFKTDATARTWFVRLER